jgi:RNA polymerase sigma-70 factor, ECF subfamily
MTSDLEQDSDDLLIARIARGHADAFAALFRRRQSDVYRFVLHMTGVPALAEDVAQDVFVIVMRDAGKYEPGRSTVAAWLCGIARNCARQRLERERRFTGIGDEPENEADIPAVHPDPLGDLTRAERVATLRRAVLALPLRYREVVVLCDLQELSYAEAADVLGCALGTVRSRLHRARSLLAVRVTALESAARGVDLQDRSPGATAPVVVRPDQKRCLA